MFVLRRLFWGADKKVRWVPISLDFGRVYSRRPDNCPEPTLGSHNPGSRQSPMLECGLSKTASPRHCGGGFFSCGLSDCRQRRAAALGLKASTQVACCVVLAVIESRASSRDQHVKAIARASLRYSLSLARSATGCWLSLPSYGSSAVAFSGGVDSTVVAKAAQLALGDRAVAVTGTSASLAAGELDEACRAGPIDRHSARGVADRRIRRIPTYLRNASDRCYHCKTELYTQLDGVAERLRAGRVRQRRESRRSGRLSARA